MSIESDRDPREVLVRQKYFSLRPRPLEQWLWKQEVCASAERVFWFHWQEGMINRDWCSEIPLKRVAALCDLDVSSVTRAYQLLAKLGLIRRQDPGRDPTRPFERAVAITEIRVPVELAKELKCHPDRARHDRAAAVEPGADLPVATKEVAGNTVPATPSDPFEGLRGRERVRALTALLTAMSETERPQFENAMRKGTAQISFDPKSKLNAEQQSRALQVLAAAARRPNGPVAVTLEVPICQAKSDTRRMSVFELARIRRDIQQMGGQADTVELLRQIVWSIEEGALRRFPMLHATRIAMKKIREKTWTRPNRMPPNWMRKLSSSEQCGTAA